ncbi:MAG: response regulator [Bacteroidota bacterium]|nr:response regulator [Bacteroidota bacterium]
MKKVLVVDDAEANRLLLGAILKKLKLSVEYAEDGDEAVHKFLQLQPDVVFMDHILPTKNGADALREMKDQDIKFVGFLMSAYSDPDQIKIIFESSGAEEFIHKPIEFVKIQKLLKKYGIIS